MKTFLLFDCGGTNTRVAVFLRGRMSAAYTFATPRDLHTAIEKIFLAGEALTGRKTIDVVCGGVAGTFDPARRVLVHAPHLRSWAHGRLYDALRKKFHTPVFLENDAALGALGEATYGAGKRAAVCGYITIGTGIGGARVVQGYIDETVFGFEPGHQLLGENTWESQISGNAFEKKFGAAPATITDRAVWRDAARVCARGLYNATLFWSPEVLVLGGSMVLKHPGIAVADVQKELRTLFKNFPVAPRVVAGALGDTAVLHGARAFIEQQISA